LRAAVFEDIRKIDYRLDYPKPVVGPNNALVKVRYCGICGSDVTNYRVKLYQTPIVMGHEFVGEVVELGENLRDFKIGDRVLGINVKLEILEGELKGLGIFIDGGFAEYVKVPGEFLFHAPESTALQECPLIESFAIAFRAIKLAKIEDHQNIVIIGGGSLGLITLSVLLSEKKPNYIIVIEPHEFLCEKAKELGATEVFSSSGRKIKKFFKENGNPTYIFECAGSENAFKIALDLITRGGTIVLGGLYRGTISFPLMLINSKEICLRGTLGHDRADILEAIAFFRQKKIDPRKLISEIIPLQEIQNAFEKFLAPGERRFIKIIVSTS